MAEIASRSGRVTSPNPKESFVLFVAPMSETASPWHLFTSTLSHHGAHTTSTEYEGARCRLLQCRHNGKVRRSQTHDGARLTPPRRTGLTLPQQKLDEHGLEEVSNLFSSPKKPSPLKQMFTAADVSDEGESESTAMTGMDSTIRFPIANVLLCYIASLANRYHAC